MKKIKVLVVDDSAFMRKMITDMLEQDDDIEVVATARNGLDALRKVQDYLPDVLTLDIEMPILNGIDTLKLLMKERPLPVIMLSSTTTEGAENTVQAMQLGAVDFIAKPSGAISLDIDKVQDILIQKVKIATTINMANMTKSFQKRSIHTNNLVHKDSNETRQASRKIVCVGTSTGGPRALQQLLVGIPANILAPIIIVQHMPAGFTQSLASRLNKLCDITVKEAEDGEIVKNGVAYIAPGGFHLTVQQAKGELLLKLDQTPILNGHRPAVNNLFESVAVLKQVEKIAIILTGMGADGTQGLKKLKETSNVFAIAESEKTCVVYGMPKSAIQQGLIDRTLDLDTIQQTLIDYVHSRGE